MLNGGASAKSMPVNLLSAEIFGNVEDHGEYHGLRNKLFHGVNCNGLEDMETSIVARNGLVLAGIVASFGLVLCAYHVAMQCNSGRSV